ECREPCANTGTGKPECRTLTRQRIVDGKRRKIDKGVQAPIADVGRHLLAEVRTSDLDGCGSAVVAQPLCLGIAANRVCSAGAQLLGAEERVTCELRGKFLVEDKIRPQRPRIAEVRFDGEVLPLRLETLRVEFVAAASEGQCKVDGRASLGDRLHLRV